MGFAGRLESANATAPVAVELTPEAITLIPEGAPPVALALSDIDDLHDDNYTLRLTDHEGRTYALSMLGKGYGQLVADLREARDAALERDLLLRGVALQDTFPGKLFGGAEPVVVDLRLYEDLLVVRPERGTMFGVPFSFIDEVTWDAELYQVHLETTDGEVVLGHLGKRSEELVAELRRLLDALTERTARTLRGLIPHADAGAVTALAGRMRDGRAVTRAEVEAVAPALWPHLETAVAGGRQDAYESLVRRAHQPDISFGVKAVRRAAENGPGEPEGQASETNDVAAARTWYFVPLARDGAAVNLVAQEVTSGEAHATYLFRAVEPGTALDDDGLRRGIARLNRALLLLNFRREPLYLPDERLGEGDYGRYRVALRKLDHLRWARSALVSRVPHDADWERAIDEAIAGA